MNAHNSVFICEICGEKEAKYTCRLCGRKACSNHYVAEGSICSVCAMLMCDICKSFLSIATCKYCGRKGCESCLVQINPVKYVCIECYKKYLLTQRGTP